MTAQYIVKKMAKIHCARGPKRCSTCKEYAKEMKYALLNVNPIENPQAARPVIAIEIEGETVWMPYDVIAYFNKLDEVKEYTEEKNITIAYIIEK